MLAGARKTGNLCAVVDANGWQATGRSAEVLALEPQADKWKAFGWDVLEMQGNDMAAVLKGLDEAKSRTGKGKPVMILMRTEMGSGVDFMVGSHEWHGIAPNDAQLADALKQLPETLGDY